MVKFFKEETGAAAVEYGLLVGLISVAIISSVNGIGQQLKALFDVVNEELKDAAAAAGA